MMLSVVASAILAANQVAGLVSAELCGGVEGSLVCMFFCLPHLHATTWNCTQTNIPLMARPFLLIRTYHRFNIGGTRMAAITEGCAGGGAGGGGAGGGGAAGRAGGGRRGGA